jgi:hypothetical protein
MMSASTSNSLSINTPVESIKEYSLVKLDYSNWSEDMYIQWNWDETVTAFTKPRSISPRGNKLDKWLRKRRKREGAVPTTPVVVASPLILSGRHHTIDATVYPVYLRLFIQHNLQWQTNQIRLFDEQYDLVMFSASDHKDQTTKKQQEPACVRLDRRQHICVSKECFMGVGAFHFLVTDQGGWKVYGAGDNQYGQLGISLDTEDRQSTTNLIHRDAKGLTNGHKGNEQTHETAQPLYPLEGVNQAHRKRRGKEKLLVCQQDSCLQQSHFAPRSPVVQVVCGGFHSAVRCEDGSVWTCGRNHYGQLGLNINRDCGQFTRVSLDIPCVQISCGYAHSAALCQDGSLWLWGRFDYFGVHGSSKGEQRKVPKTDEHTCILGKPKRVTLLDGKAGAVVCIDCGPYHTVALMEDDTVVGFGLGDSGQLGIGLICNTALNPSILHSPGAHTARPIYVGACAFSTIIVFDNKAITSFPPTSYITSSVKPVTYIPPVVRSRMNNFGHLVSSFRRRLKTLFQIKK